jgi:hypothetical protein
MKDEVGWVCSAHGGYRNACRTLFGKREGKNDLENLVVDGRIILNGC